MIIRKSRPAKYKKRALLSGLLLITVAAIIAVLEVTNTTHLFHEKKATSGVIPSTSTSRPPTSSKDKAYTPTVPSAETPATPTSSGSPKEGDTPASPTPTPSGAAPKAPFGNFVSNHKPNLGGTPTPSTIESVCNTTPGASCRMEFTNSESVVKRLATQVTDSTGATYWSWDIKQAGLTAGIWKIKAIAELRGQTTITNSSQDLEVNP